MDELDELYLAASDLCRVAFQGKNVMDFDRPEVGRLFRALDCIDGQHEEPTLDHALARQHNVRIKIIYGESDEA